MSAGTGLPTAALVYLGVTAVAGAVAFFVSLVAWRNRHEPGSIPFALYQLAVGIWCASFIGVRLHLGDPLIVKEFAYMASFAAPLAFLAFVLVYTGRKRFLLRVPVAGTLTAWLTVVVASLWIPSIGQLFITSPTTATETSLGMTVVPVPPATPLGYLVTLVVPVGFQLVGVFLLLGFLFRSRNMYRRETGLITVAAVLPLLGLVISFATPEAAIDWTSSIQAGSGVLIAWAMFRGEFLDVGPLAGDALVENMSDALLVLNDSDEIIDYNPAFESLNDWDTDPRGRSVADVVPGLLQAMEANEPIYLDRSDLRADGGTLGVYEPRTTELYDHHDRRRGRLVLLRDVTVQTQRERTLEAMQTATRRFIEATSTAEVATIACETVDGVLDYPYAAVVLKHDDADRLVPAAMTRQIHHAIESVGQLVNVPDDEIPWEVFESGEPKYMVDIDGALQDRFPVEVGTVALLPLGEHGLLGIGGRRSRDAISEDDRRFLDILASTTETALDRVTRREQLRESRETIRQRNEQLSFFNSALRHDLLNAVTVIKGTLGLVEPHVSGEGHDHLETVTHWIDDVESMIRKVRSITRAVADEETAALEDVALASVVTRRVEKVTNAHESVAVSVDVPDELAVRADDLLGEVLENLLLNAVEHHDRDAPTIEVSATATGDTVTLRVADDGPGLSEDLADDVFDPDVTTDDSQTLGFGLYFVRTMMEQYGGRIRFESNDPRGTVAVLEFEAGAVRTAEWEDV